MLYRMNFKPVFLLSTIFFNFSLAQTPDSPIEWEEDRVITKGRGIKGPWEQNESNYQYVDDPSVAVSGEKILVGWVNQTKQDVFFQRLSPGSMEPISGPINISNNSETFSWLPRIAVSPDDPDHIYILWQEIIFSGGSHGGEALMAHSSDGGKTFSEPINLSKSKSGDGKGRITQEIWDNGSIDVIASTNGKVIAAWTEFEGSLLISTSDNYGKSFSKPKLIAGGPGELPVRGPSLALGPDNTVYIAWTNGDNPGADIKVQKSKDGGDSFSKAEVVKKTEGFSDAPKIRVDSEGTIHLVYSEGQTAMPGRFGKFDIMFTQSKDGAKTFKDPIAISNPQPEGAQSARYPYLSIDKEDNIYVLCELFPDPRNYPRGLGISISNNKGKDFSEPSFVPGSKGPLGGTNGSQQGLLMDKLAVDKDGTIYIVNSSLKRNEGSRVWIIKGKKKHK